MRLAVLGAGQIGNAFAFHLVRQGGHDVTVIARPDSRRLDQLERDGAIVSASGDLAPVRVPDGAPRARAGLRITLDGQPPGRDHGSDVNATGEGTVDGQRLFQLVRQAGTVRDRTFAIEFSGPGAQAFSFTFG